MKYFSNVDWRRVATYAGLPVIGMLAAFTLLAFIGPINIGDAWPAWVQAIGGILAVLVAAGVPTGLYLCEQRKARRREAARAKCAFAASLDPLENQLATLLDLHCHLLDNKRNQNLLEDAHAATRTPDETKDALAVGHEFPDLADHLVKFVVTLGHANVNVVKTKNYGLEKWIAGEDPYEITSEVGLALDAGIELLQRVSKMLRD